MSRYKQVIEYTDKFERRPGETFRVICGISFAEFMRVLIK